MEQFTVKSVKLLLACHTSIITCDKTFSLVIGYDFLSYLGVLAALLAGVPAVDLAGDIPSNSRADLVFRLSRVDLRTSSFCGAARFYR